MKYELKEQPLNILYFKSSRKRKRECWTSLEDVNQTARHLCDFSKLTNVKKNHDDTNYVKTINFNKGK